MWQKKTIKICPSQHIDLFRCLFTKNSLKIKNGLEIVFRSHFSLKNLKNLSFVILPKLEKFHYEIVLHSKMCFMFHACAFDNVRTIVWKGVSAPSPFFFHLPFLIFLLSLETCNPPSWHTSKENTRFYDDTLESVRLKTI